MATLPNLSSEIDRSSKDAATGISILKKNPLSPLAQQKMVVSVLTTKVYTRFKHYKCGEFSSLFSPFIARSMFELPLICHIFLLGDLAFSNTSNDKYDLQFTYLDGTNNCHSHKHSSFESLHPNTVCANY
jgi:hypothetical protein